jgi:hypothetical protein
MRSRLIITAGVLVLIAVLAGLIGYRERGTIAVWLAPDKVASAEASDRSTAANAQFWDAFHNGRYDDIPQVLEALTAAYLENPRDAETASHIGFTHTWRFSEQVRLQTRSARVTDHITLARKYFAEAVRLAPDDERVKGFHAGMELAEAFVHGDEKLRRRGYFDLMKAVDGWPEFNLFTAGYIFSRLPFDDPRYSDGVEYQWRTLDLCAGEKVDRRTAQYAQYMAKETTEGRKRVCWNSWIAPHNFEGFFLNMGDMLVKRGDPAIARLVYANAKLSKTYEDWPFKVVLEDRIAQAEENVALFRGPTTGETIRTMMISSAFACGACHRT